MKKVLAGMVGVGMLCVAFTAFSAEEEAAKKVEIKYNGSKSCIACHKKRDDSVSKWEASKHAKSLESLSSEASKKFEAPTKTADCLRCHVTGLEKEGGYSVEGDAKANENVANVSCEACHGPGKDYAKAMMKGMKEPQDPKIYADAGLIVPKEDTCKGCHNADNPFHKEFKFEEAIKSVKHGELLKAEK